MSSLVFHLSFQRLLGSLICSFKSHMLEEMSNAVIGISLKTTSNVNPKTNLTI